jgi:hypothetical protein
MTQTISVGEWERNRIFRAVGSPQMSSRPCDTVCVSPRRAPLGRGPSTGASRHHGYPVKPRSRSWLLHRVQGSSILRGWGLVPGPAQMERVSDLPDGVVERNQARRVRVDGSTSRQPHAATPAQNHRTSSCIAYPARISIRSTPTPGTGPSSRRPLAIPDPRGYRIAKLLIADRSAETIDISKVYRGLI